ncbi:thioesterase domain-containing protein [Amycolatopsis cihanbeyliensis]|uniref:Thioesterase domain-containing protein n=1 Tax=Amycolatopsis cihanbeyliensis TaxID=1128664 RepID=A0A542DBS3_AMYCI|nr:thioesterase domain-containing protein [Amycolatopsis cihanbeyliensis]TQJ00528.1 thioesterase domain-containing protein [Amycolatopsis cihanbeyliensis]
MVSASKSTWDLPLVYLLDIRDVLLARHYARYIRDIQPDGPYLLGGWSFGGVTATEVARLLLEQGHEVRPVVLLDGRAPEQMAHQLAGLTEFLDSWEPYLAAVPRLLATPDLGDDDIEASGVPVALARTMLSLDEHSIHRSLLTAPHARAVARAHIHAMRHHRPAALTVPVIVVRAADQPDVFGNDPLLGWRDLATAGITAHEALGDHFSMPRSPNVSSLATWLSSVLAGRGIEGG